MKKTNNKWDWKLKKYTDIFQKIEGFYFRTCIAKNFILKNQEIKLEKKKEENILQRSARVWNWRQFQTLLAPRSDWHHVLIGTWNKPRLVFFLIIFFFQCLIEFALIERHHMYKGYSVARRSPQSRKAWSLANDSEVSPRSELQTN